MDTKDFATFVANQQETVDEPRVDWIEVRDKWLGALDSLHQRVLDYLQDYIKAGSISYSFSEVTLTEENIGSYIANRMDIKIGRQLVHLEPIGTLLIGSKGRVDAVGSAGRAQILLVNEKAKSAADLIKVTVTVGVNENLPPRPSATKQPISWAWKIVTNTSPRKFVNLDKERFLELLLEIANA